MKNISKPFNFSPTFLKSHGSTLLVCSTSNSICIFYFESLDNFKTVQLQQKTYCLYDLSMDFSDNLKMVCSALSNQNSTTIFMNPQNRKTKLNTDHFATVYGVAVSKGLSNRIVTVSNDKNVCIKHLYSLKIVKILKNHFKRDISTVLFFDNEKYIITGSYDKSIKVISLQDYQVKRIFHVESSVFALDVFGESLFAGGRSNNLFEFRGLRIKE